MGFRSSIFSLSDIKVSSPTLGPVRVAGGLAIWAPRTSDRGAGEP